jgi:tetratricopeptide (TPR) repeat protein
LQSQKRWQEAATAYRKAIELSSFNPNSSDLNSSYAAAWLKLGECLQELRDNPAAAEAFRQALRYDPALTAARDGLDKVGKK